MPRAQPDGHDSAPGGRRRLSGTLIWALPFAGLLLSIALLPLVASRFWHRHFGKVAAFWAAAFIVPLSIADGAAAALGTVAHALLVDYLPFIILLVALYAVTGGIRVTGTLRGTPGVNTSILALGTALASITGTTGAAMLLVRPLIRANRHRRRNRHVLVFFIILVANIGGALSPIGDPPLFLGFLEGVPFFWPTVHLFLPTLLTAALLLVLFWLVDAWYGRREPAGVAEAAAEKLGIDGRVNFILLGAIIVSVVLSGVWQSGIIVVGLRSVTLALEQVAAIALLLVITAASLILTPRKTRLHNEFGWAAMAEVAILFAAIFITIVPMLAIVRAGAAGPAAPLVALLGDAARPDNRAFFWLTGLLSAVLDNAPTYLVFFNFAGGDAATLSGTLAPTLAAISSGAVYFGALTYIGNAPNLMVKAVAERNGIAMPGFFSYLACAAALLLPLFLVLSLIFF